MVRHRSLRTFLAGAGALPRATSRRWCCCCADEAARYGLALLRQQVDEAGLN